MSTTFFSNCKSLNDFTNVIQTDTEPVTLVDDGVQFFVDHDFDVSNGIRQQLFLENDTLGKTRCINGKYSMQSQNFDGSPGTFQSSGQHIFIQCYNNLFQNFLEFRFVDSILGGYNVSIVDVLDSFTTSTGAAEIDRTEAIRFSLQITDDKFIVKVFDDDDLLIETIEITGRSNVGVYIHDINIGKASGQPGLDARLILQYIYGDTEAIDSNSSFDVLTSSLSYNMSPYLGVDSTTNPEVNYDSNGKDKYVVDITFNNPGAFDADAEFNFMIDTQAIINSGKMSETCNDIRIFDPSGQEVDNIYIESPNTPYTLVWIRSELAAGNSVFKLQYGNIATPPRSDIRNMKFYALYDYQTKLWIKANEGILVRGVSQNLGVPTGVSSRVRRWTNKALNITSDGSDQDESYDLYQNTNNAQPEFFTNITDINNLPAVSFYGFNYLQCNNVKKLDLDLPSAFVVGKSDLQFSPFMAKNDNSQSINSTSRRKMQLFWGGYGSGADGDNINVSNTDFGVWQQLSVQAKASNSHVSHINGAQQFHTNSLNYTNYNDQPLYVGGAFPPSAEMFDGQIAEIIIINNCSDATRDAVNEYLRVKYKLYGSQVTYTLGSENFINNNFSYVPRNLQLESLSAEESLSNDFYGIAKTKGKATVKNIEHVDLIPGSDVENWFFSEIDEPTNWSTGGSVTIQKLSRKSKISNNDIYEFTSGGNLSFAKYTITKNFIEGREYNFGGEFLITEGNPSNPRYRLQFLNGSSIIESHFIDIDSFDRFAIEKKYKSTITAPANATGCILTLPFNLGAGVKYTVSNLRIQASQYDKVNKGRVLSLTDTPSVETVKIRRQYNSRDCVELDKYPIKNDIFPAYDLPITGDDFLTFDLIINDIDSFDLPTSKVRFWNSDFTESKEATLDKNTGLVVEGFNTILIPLKEFFDSNGSPDWSDLNEYFEVEFRNSTGTQNVTHKNYRIIKNFDSSINEYKESTPIEVKFFGSDDNQRTWVWQDVTDGRVTKTSTQNDNLTFDFESVFGALEQKTFNQVSSFNRKYSTQLSSNSGVYNSSYYLFDTVNYSTGAGSIHKDFISKIMEFVYPKTKIQIDIGTNFADINSNELVYKLDKNKYYNTLLEDLAKIQLGIISRLPDGSMRFRGAGRWLLDATPDYNIPINKVLDFKNLRDKKSTILNTVKYQTYIRPSLDLGGFGSNVIKDRVIGTGGYGFSLPKNSISTIIIDQERLGLQEAEMVDNIIFQGWSVGDSADNNNGLNSNPESIGIFRKSYYIRDKQLYFEVDNTSATDKYLKSISLRADVIPYVKQNSIIFEDIESRNKYGNKEIEIDDYYPMYTNVVNSKTFYDAVFAKTKKPLLQHDALVEFYPGLSLGDVITIPNNQLQTIKGVIVGRNTYYTNYNYKQRVRIVQID